MAIQKTKKGRERARANLKATMWKRGESGNPNGRPRKVLSELSERIKVDFQVSLSKEDKHTIIEAMSEMSFEELKSIATDKRAPAFMAIVASALKRDLSTGSMAAINSLLDRLHGRPDQVSKVELANKDGEALRVRSELSDNELDERIKHIERVLSVAKGEGPESS